MATKKGGDDDDEFEYGADLEEEPSSGENLASADNLDDDDEAGLSNVRVDRSNPFHKHPASYTTYSTITDIRYQKKIQSLAKELHEFAEQHQTLLRQRLTYEELLQGMLYPGEDLIPVKPLLIRDFVEKMVDKTVVVERFGVRMFLTNKRLFFLDADLERIPMLEAEENSGGLVLSKLKVTYEVTDDIWYYPVPLTNLKGMSLDIHFATTAVGWIAQKRPWWAIIMSLLGFAMLAWGIYKLMELQQQDLGLLIGSGLLSLLGPMLFLGLKVYSRSEFTPRVEQQRRVTLGCKDPITQQHMMYELYLEDGYSMIEAKNYLSLMQEYAPHLSGFVLAD